MKIKRLISILFSVLLLCIAAVPVNAEGELYIETKTVYDGMNESYENGYIPTVENDEVRIVLPLKGGKGSSLTVVPNLGDVSSCPFIYCNYNMTVKRNSNGVFVIDLKLKLAESHVKGVYPVVFDVTSSEGTTGSFTVFITVPTSANKPKTEEGYVDFHIGNVACPESIEAGSDFSAKLTVKNIGGAEAKNVKLNYSCESAALTPLGNTHFLLLDDLAAGESREVDLPLHLAKDAASGRYGIAVELSYRTAEGNEMTMRDGFYVEVRSQISITFDEPDLSNGVTEDTPVFLSANIYNTGGTPIYDVFVSVEGQGVYSDTSTLRVYHKSIMPGETAPGQIEALFYSAKQYLNPDGTLPVTYRVTYKDERGKQYEENRVYNVALHPAKAAEPAATPEPAKVNTQGQYWTVLIAIISVIAVITAITIARTVIRKVKIK